MILLTGDMGFIGSHLKSALNAVNINFESFDIINGCDITDRLHLYNAFTQGQYDMVVHLAALTSVKRGELFPKEMTSTNVEGTYNLIDMCHKFEIKKFIYFSSSSVLGGNVDILDETSSYAPLSMYGITKAAAEMLVKNSGLEYVIIRPFSVYGENGRQDQVIYKWINQIKKEQPITFYGDGSSGRGYTYIGDLIKAVIEIICADWKLWRKLNRQIIHLGGKEIITLQQLKNIVEDYCRENQIKWSGFEVQPRSNIDISASYANIAKARKILNYDPAPKFKEIVEKILEKEFKINNPLPIGYKVLEEVGMPVEKVHDAMGTYHIADTHIEEQPEQEVGLSFGEKDCPDCLPYDGCAKHYIKNGDRYDRLQGALTSLGEKLAEIKKKIIEKSSFEHGVSSNGWYQIYKDDLDSIL